MSIDKAVLAQWIKARASEPSTWRGIIHIATACGVIIQPELIELIVAGGLALAGMIGVSAADKK